MVNFEGYREVTFDNEVLADFFKNKDETLCKANILLSENEYIAVYDANNCIAFKGKMKHGKTLPILKPSANVIKSKFFNVIKPRNLQQEFLIDMLKDPTIRLKCTHGGFGTGKDLLMLSNAIQDLEDGRFQKLVFIRNNVNVKDSPEIGFLKGDNDEKLMPFAMPIADHLGGRSELEARILKGEIELQHLGFIRGRDIRDSIIYITESENLTKELVQLIISRCGEGSVVYFNGDFRQTDNIKFERNNGLKSMIEKLYGNPLFCNIKLIKSERSEVARLADLMD